MKTVYSKSSEVIHLFANQIQEQAKNQSRNVFFYNNSLYSYGYHYKLALNLNNETVLINDVGYSNTTAKHISEVTQATRHKKRFFATEVLIKNVSQEVELLTKKLPRARQRKIEYINRIKRLFEQLNQFNIFCVDNNIKSIKWSNNNNIKTQIDKRSKEYKRLQHIVKNLDNLEILEEEVKEAESRAKKKRDKEQKQLIRQYRLGKRDFVRLDYDLLQLRYGDSTESNKIEKMILLKNLFNSYYIHTSQDVKLELDEGLRAIKMLEDIKYSECKINEHLKWQKIDHYTIKGAKNNALIVGCHKIKFKEIQRLSKQIKQLITKNK